MRELFSGWVVNCLIPKVGPGQITGIDGDYIAIQFDGREPAEYKLRDLGQFLVKAASKEAAQELCNKLAVIRRSERETLVEEFATAARRKERAAAIRKIRDKRGIRHLVHFTRIENLSSIARDRALHSRAWLVAERREFLPCDEARRDGDKNINLSVEFPNYRMFYLKRCKLDPDEGSWAVLVFDAVLLEELECAFVETNAAAHHINTQDLRRHTTAAALKRLFRERVPLKDGQLVERSGLRIPASYPTDPQAEVLVREDVSLEYLAYVAVSDNSVVQDARFPASLASIARADPRLFKPREDHPMWSKKEDSKREKASAPIFELL